jgi:trehalose/maltose transport system substrate-binding protein
MPAGEAGSAGALGGKGTGISIHSAHRKEAIELLRYQLHALMQSGEREKGGGSAPRTELSDVPSISGMPGSGTDSNQRGSIVARPSIATGSAYKDVSKAYFDAVYSFLTGRRKAPEAAAALEKQLIEITGFRAGPPKRGDKSFP